MLSVIGFLIILGPLVVVHEFGHYIFARIFGVKAEAFSIGFGPKLWTRQLGETELRISAVPVGGYVKLLGEDREAPLPPEEAKRALHRQPGWKRFFIFFGGPLFNLVFAVFIFMAILAIGEPETANVVGRVVADSPAAKAGFESGDRILTVQGKAMKRFDDIASVIHDNPSRPLEFQVVHPGAQSPVLLTATPTPEQGYSVYAEATMVGRVDGLSPIGRGLEAGVSDPASAAGRAGIATGDRVIEVNGVAMKSWEDIEAAYAAAPAGSKLALRVQKPSGTEEKIVELTKPIAAAAPLRGQAPSVTPSQEQAPRPQAGPDSMGAAWGLYSSELFVERTIKDSPAAKAGIQPGDRLIAVGGKTVYSFFDLKDAVQASGEKEDRVPLQWERGGKTLSDTLIPTRTSGRDPDMKTTEQYTVGVVPMLSLADPVTIVERIWNPFTLVYKGSERVVTFTWRNLVSVGKMVTGNVSVGTLGGPILIGKIAGESLSHGLITFLTTMAILSIGLGVLNLLPVPILDGGHIVLLLIEGVRGKPLTMRQMEIVQGVGLALILMLMGVVIKNDITRLVSF